RRQDDRVDVVAREQAREVAARARARVRRGVGGERLRIEVAQVAHARGGDLREGAEEVLAPVAEPDDPDPQRGRHAHTTLRTRYTPCSWAFTQRRTLWATAQPMAAASTARNATHTAGTRFAGQPSAPTAAATVTPARTSRAPSRARARPSGGRARARIGSESRSRRTTNVRDRP